MTDLLLVEIATAGFVSARLVTVAIADRGAASDLKCVVLIKVAACLPGAELSSDRFLLTSGAAEARGKIEFLASVGTSRTSCQPYRANRVSIIHMRCVWKTIQGSYLALPTLKKTLGLLRNFLRLLSRGKPLKEMPAPLSVVLLP